MHWLIDFRSPWTEMAHFLVVDFCWYHWFLYHSSQRCEDERSDLFIDLYYLFWRLNNQSDVNSIHDEEEERSTDRSADFLFCAWPSSSFPFSLSAKQQQPQNTRAHEREERRERGKEEKKNDRPLQSINNASTSTSTDTEGKCVTLFHSERFSC